MSFIDHEARFESFAEPNNLECTRMDSSHEDEYVDGMVNGHQNMIGEFQSLEIRKADGSCDEPSSDHCFDAWEMVSGDSIVECLPDYIVYRDIYSTDSAVTFSSSCIKIEGYRQAETFIFQWEVDHIINIESQCFEGLDLAIVKIRVISEGTTPTEDIHGNTGFEEFKFAVAEDWNQKQDEIMSLDVYKPLWKIVANSDMESEGKALLGSHMSSSSQYFPSFEDFFKDLIYPKGDPDAVSISKRDVDLLQPDTFVNDTIIDFYIKYLKNKIDPSERHRFHFFNSFFFRKLADLDKNPSSALEGRAAYLRVRKWTRKVNLFEKDYIFIPVNFNYHWSLVVICHLGEVCNLQEADASESLNLPCILHMDSIRGSHSGLKGILQSYVWEEWKERQLDTSEDISSRFSNIRFFSLELPQQPNMYDCGLFLLHYVELFLEENLVTFNPFRISRFSNFLTANWFQPAEASLKRAYIERLIHGIIDGDSRESSPRVRGGENCTSMLPRSTGENGTTLEFLSERSSPSKLFHESVPGSQDGQGIELKLLQTSPVKSIQCVNDSGFFVRNPAEEEALVESLCQASEDIAPSEEFKCAMSSMEGEDNSGKHFKFSSSAAGGHEHPTSITCEASITSLSKESRDEQPLWNPASNIHQGAHRDIGSFKESICASDEISESEDVNRNKMETNLSIDVSLSQNNMELSTVSRVSSSSDHMLDGNNNACPDYQGSPPQACDPIENASGTCEPMQSVYDGSVSEPCVEQATKRRRLASVEEEGLQESSCGDLDS